MTCDQEVRVMLIPIYVNYSLCKSFGNENKSGTVCRYCALSPRPPTFPRRRMVVFFCITNVTPCFGSYYKCFSFLPWWIISWREKQRPLLLSVGQQPSDRLSCILKTCLGIRCPDPYESSNIRNLFTYSSLRSVELRSQLSYFQPMLQRLNGESR
jgi:hypothetical protein